MFLLSFVDNPRAFDDIPGCESLLIPNSDTPEELRGAVRKLTRTLINPLKNQGGEVISPFKRKPHLYRIWSLFVGRGA